MPKTRCRRIRTTTIGISKVRVTFIIQYLIGSSGFFFLNISSNTMTIILMIKNVRLRANALTRFLFVELSDTVISLSSFPISSFPVSSFPISLFPISSFPVSSFPMGESLVFLRTLIS